MKGLIKMIFIAFALPVMFVLLFYLIGNLLQKEVIISSLSSEVYQAADEIDISEKLLRRAIKEMEELDESKLSDLIKGIERNSWIIKGIGNVFLIKTVPGTIHNTPSF